jgi:hypothetical protein
MTIDVLSRPLEFQKMRFVRRPFGCGSDAERQRFVLGVAFVCGRIPGSRFDNAGSQNGKNGGYVKLGYQPHKQCTNAIVTGS